MKRVLLTGASGFIGQHAVSSLLRRGYEVHAVSSAAQWHGSHTQLWHQANLLDAREVDDLLERIQPTHLMHLAWYTVPHTYWNAPQNLDWVQASLTLVQAFSRHGGQRAVLVGSCAEYDWNYGYCVETLTPCAPKTLYGTCKHALQVMTTAYADHVDLSCAWARMFLLFGPHEQPVRFVPSIILSLLRANPADCSHGAQIRDYLYVADAADALAALLDSDVCGPINIASGRPLVLRDLARQVAAKLDGLDLLRFGVAAAPEDDAPVLLGSIRRLASDVGWRPNYSLAAALDATIHWWRRHLPHHRT